MSKIGKLIGNVDGFGGERPVAGARIGQRQMTIA